MLTLGPFRLYTFGILFALGAWLGLELMFVYLRRVRVAAEPRILVPLILLTALAGAKLDDALVNGVHSRGLAGFFTEGYTYLGGVVLAMLACAAYTRWRRLPWLRGYDCLFCLAPAYAVGRIGCFLAGDGDYGRPSSLPWAVAFPHGLVPTADRVQPTMLYLALWELLIFAALWRLARRRPRAGTLLGLYLVATSSGRFLVEFLSRNPVVALGLTEAQWVSLAGLLAGIPLLLWLYFPQRVPSGDVPRTS